MDVFCSGQPVRGYLQLPGGLVAAVAAAPAAGVVHRVVMLLVASSLQYVLLKQGCCAVGRLMG